MSSRAREPTKPVKKYARSTSPRTQERRRLQNRIAQRNHRRRIKEATEVASLENGGYELQDKDSASSRRQGQHDDASAARHLQHPAGDDAAYDLNYIDPDLHAAPTQDSSPSDIADEGFIPDNALPHKPSPPAAWLGVDQMMTMNISPPNDGFGIHPNGSSYFAHPSCTCNSVTGPCAAHLEKIRSEMLAVSAPPHQLMQHPPFQHPRHHAGEDALAHQMSHASHMSQYSSSMSSEPHPQPLLAGQHSRAPSSRRSAPSTSSLSSIRGSPTTNGRSTSEDAAAPQSMSSSSSKSKATTQTSTSSSEAADVTGRFKTILEVVQTAGFPDFDRMVVAYYTAQFEKGSLPALMQRASRGRRLKTVLQDLRKSSDSWPLWESKGLYESAIETTKSLCVNEMERLEADQMDPAQVDASDLVSALGWLLNSPTGDNDMMIDKDTGDGVYRLGGRGSQQYVSPLSERMEAVQDSVPYLWSLLTEFAGPQGLYCDKIAQAVLTILLDARQTQ